MTSKLTSDYFPLGSYGLPVVSKPTNGSPASAEVAGTQNPVLTSSGYKSLYDTPQLAAEFIVYDATGTTIIQQSGILTPAGSVPINTWTVPTPLALSTGYMWSHKFRSTIGEDYVESAKTAFSVPSATVGTPTITSPTDSSTTTSLDISVSASPFVALGAAQTHTETTLEIATDIGFTSIVQTIVKSTGDLTSVDVTLANPNTTYYFRIKYEGSTTLYSANSPIISVTSVENTVSKPTITSPTDNTTEVQSTVLITSSAFSYEGAAQTQDLVQWIIYNDVALTDIFFDSGIIATDLQTITISGMVESQDYYITKRDSGSISGFGEFSTASKFVTSAQFANWSAWNGTVDGVPMQVNSDSQAYDGSIANRGIADIGGGRYFVLSRTTALYGEVIATSGLALAGGGQTSIATATWGQVIRLGDDRVLIVYNVSTIRMRVYTISGNSIVPQAAEFDTAITPYNASGFGIASVSDTKAMFTASTGASTFNANVVTITAGGVVSMGAIYNPPDLNMMPGRLHSWDVRNNLALVVGVQGSGTTNDLYVLEINTTTNLITTKAQIEVTTGVLTESIFSLWLTDNTIVLSLGNKTWTGSFDGVSTLTTLAFTNNNMVMTSGWGVGILALSSTEFFQTFYSGAGKDYTGMYSKIESGNIFNYTPTVISSIVGATATITTNSIIKIDEGRIMAMYSNHNTPAGLVIEMLNGVPV